MINKKQFLLGILALLAGLAEYVFHRPPNAGYLGRLIRETMGPHIPRADIYGPFSGAAPDFFHPLAFVLITMCLIPDATRTVRAAICLVWLSVELFFEMGQGFGPQIADMVGRHPLGERLPEVTGYFAGGTYDPMDIIAFCAGILTAYIIGTLTITKNSEGGTKTYGHAWNGFITRGKGRCQIDRLETLS